MQHAQTTQLGVVTFKHRRL